MPIFSVEFLLPSRWKTVPWPYQDKDSHALRAWRQTMNERLTKGDLSDINPWPDDPAPVKEARLIGMYQGRRVVVASDMDVSIPSSLDDEEVRRGYVTLYG